ncbi:hypothetical protein [Streptomyces sp. AF1A]|uniref:hypothetical protein n=1 Tax=Streptomyces sp. AF1A TaxID=3394350 RepID=UPI0039BD83E1
MPGRWYLQWARIGSVDWGVVPGGWRRHLRVSGAGGARRCLHGATRSRSGRDRVTVEAA